MDVLLNEFTDLQLLLLTKLTLFFFLGASIFILLRRLPSWLFLACFGATSAAAYVVLVHGSLLPIGGLIGDEQTIAAMYQMFAEGSIFSDFAYADLPPFYPPLWFQAFGFLGHLLDWNGVQIGKRAAFATLAFFPLFFYWIERRFPHSFSPLTSLLSAFFLFVLVPWNAILIKPYELVSAALVVLWATLLLFHIHDGKRDTRRLLLYGLTGGVLFLFYYFWFFLISLGIALFHLSLRSRVSSGVYRALVFVGLVVLAVGAWYWLPLVHVYQSAEPEYFQTGFFVQDWISVVHPLFSWSLAGLLSFFGLGTLVILRHERVPRILLSFFAAGYLWQFMGLVTLFGFGVSLQEDKAFHFFHGAILAIAAAIGIERLLGLIRKQWPRAKEVETGFAVAGLLFLSPSFLPGAFAERIADTTHAVRPGLLGLADFLKTEPDLLQTTTLTSGIPELHAFVAFSEFLYFNQHNSHPAARFSERLLALRDLSLSRDPEHLYDTIDRLDIGRFVFYKGEAKPEMFTLYFQVDNFPNQLREERVHMPKHFFVEPFVRMVYENEHFVVFERVKER